MKTPQAPWPAGTEFRLAVPGPLPASKTYTIHVIRDRPTGLFCYWLRIHNPDPFGSCGSDLDNTDRHGLRERVSLLRLAGYTRRL